MKKLLTLCCIAASLLVVGCNRTADKGGADGSELYGYVNIRLPHIEGMHECHTHPRVMAFTERYRQSGPILGYYLDDATYPRVDTQFLTLTCVFPLPALFPSQFPPLERVISV